MRAPASARRGSCRSLGALLQKPSLAGWTGATWAGQRRREDIRSGCPARQARPLGAAGAARRGAAHRMALHAQRDVCARARQELEPELSRALDQRNLVRRRALRAEPQTPGHERRLVTRRCSGGPVVVTAHCEHPCSEYPRCQPVWPCSRQGRQGPSPDGAQSWSTPDAREHGPWGWGWQAAHLVHGRPAAARAGLHDQHVADAHVGPEVEQVVPEHHRLQLPPVGVPAACPARLPAMGPRQPRAAVQRRLPAATRFPSSAPRSPPPTASIPA